MPLQKYMTLFFFRLAETKIFIKIIHLCEFIMQVDVSLKVNTSKNTQSVWIHWFISVNPIDKPVCFEAKRLLCEKNTNILNHLM